jgi:CRP/FNR family transcriptional regulator, cyclic AMP receptor protein
MSLKPTNPARETAQERIAILSQHGWLSHVSPDFRTELLAEITWRRFEAGQAVSMAGADGGELLGLCDGVLAITSGLGTPDSMVTLHLARPPFWIGHGPLVTGDPRRATAVARSGGWLARIGAQRFHGLLSANPGWWRNVALLVAEYGDTAFIIAADLAIRGSEQRLAAVITRMSGHRPGLPGPAIDILPITQKELAEAANLSRNTAVAILGRFAARGLIETRRPGIAIRRPEALLAIVEGRGYPMG